jgi:acetyl esterase/lipase
MFAPPPATGVKYLLWRSLLFRLVPAHVARMKLLLTLTALWAVLPLARAQEQAAIPLWPNAVPGALGSQPKDIPSVTPYLPDAASKSHAAMVICPGGGYTQLVSHEGRDYALWLCQHGVTCFVLKYRLGSDGYRHPVELEDAARAVRWVRAHAADYDIDPHHLGIMGSSAGGHLAATLVTHFDAGNAASDDPVEKESSRPDLGILCYAVITMGKFTHQGSKDNLLGKDPTPDLVALLSDELQVTSNTPPCFLWTTFEDSLVPMENTMMFAEALRSNNVPFSLHVYEKGRHGLGLGGKALFTHLHPWTADCLYWLKERNFVN